MATHGQSNTRLYSIWCSMKSRCLCRTKRIYPYYGGRGITVCKEWVESFVAFRDWSSTAGYGDKLQLDRIDVNGGYCPFNCRWADRYQQMANTRKRSDAVTSSYKCVSWNNANSNWRAQISYDGTTHHIGSFDVEADAARAYDLEALRLRGKYALLNFPHKEVPVVGANPPSKRSNPNQRRHLRDGREH